ncbi:class I SAM-dependent methyltransferase [Christiangramia sediminis]|uniref:Class I SAM-dependent methyltransferase n=1 Tax=Christiangramia sediminis TaxID=2881336 RepID=A0A9X1LJ75_9FLAO|nr:class I SAM-dependent methyltransferase [Christiangramia sediminis]MCB7481314.1 class I SAM-dependent methyltransferase [Christiangramia sediminis]
MAEKKDLTDKQKEFYETKKKNLPTKVWSFFRNGLLNKTRKNIGIQNDIYELHKVWFGDLSNKKVLDLGCFEGNALSIFLAQNAREYIAIDLSESAITKFSKRLENIPHARAIAVDFLSEEFLENEFDLIYAYGVLHHFKDTKFLIERLKLKLKPKGEIISYDPLETSLPIKLIRRIYRPFQSDKEWEWPFSRKVYYLYAKAFDVKERHAVLGKAKWFFMISLLPLSSKKKDLLGKKWHVEDWKRSQNSDSYMFSCMHLTILMRNK